ncbi:multidrug transporter [Muricauda ruestringensis]|uniref:Multidrug transporter n=1 Tax=Flagellimonas aurea TaxID=2915619 RepID=A0ABS3G856_9FLAO|nr:bestrophin family ion channel [Allomuricauda aurea]MBO0355595.1 multidrug transporter [Allomuricauda aurea]
MHIGSHYRIGTFLFWTRRNILKLFLWAVFPTVLYGVFDLKWLAIPWQPVALVGTAAAFIAGFKNTQTYGRLWEARKIWGAIVNDSRTWGIMSRDFIVNTDCSKEDLHPIHKRLIYRHIAWLTALRFQLRQPKPWENMDRPHAKEFRKRYSVPEWESQIQEQMRPYLSKEDMDHVLQKKNRATQLLALQSMDLRELRKKGLIGEYPYVGMESVLKDFFTHQGRAERIKNFPYPRQFASINMFFIVLFSILVPFGMLDEFAKLGEYGVWLTIPFSVVVGWVFTSLEQVGESTENPFEGGANDIPMAALSRTIEIDLREMLDETDLPPNVEPVDEILM